MNYGIITLAVVSCRADASHRAEQITQLLFGETYQVLEEKTEWIYIQSTYDNYKAWIDRKHHHSISEKAYESYQKGIKEFSLDCTSQVVNHPKNEKTLISIGSSLHRDEDGSFFVEQRFTHEGSYASKSVKDLLTYAHIFLNTPYLWGGRTPLGIDCSGFVQMCFKLCNIWLPRDSYQQAEIGQTVDALENVKSGDLCFFGNDKRIDHVGLFLDQKRVIHASGKVKIDAIDATGIWIEETGTYSHYLKKIQRVF